MKFDAEILDFSLSVARNVMEGSTWSTPKNFYIMCFTPNGEVTAVVPPAINAMVVTGVESVVRLFKCDVVVQMSFHDSRERALDGKPFSSRGLRLSYFTREWYKQLDYSVLATPKGDVILSQLGSGKYSHVGGHYFGDAMDDMANWAPSTKEATELRVLVSKIKEEVSMSARDVAKFMRENGFEYLRDTKNGTMWTDGMSRITTLGRYNSVRAYRNLQADVRRAVSIRNKPEPKPAPVASAPLLEAASVKLRKPEPEKVVPVVVEPPKEEPKPVLIPTSPTTAVSVADDNAEQPPKAKRRYQSPRLHVPLEQRLKMWKYIREQHFEGKRNDVIAKDLNAAGYTRGTGQPVDAPYVGQVIYQLRHRGELDVEHREQYFRSRAFGTTAVIVPQNAKSQPVSLPPSPMLPPVPPVRPVVEAPRVVVPAVVSPPAPVKKGGLPDAIKAIIKGDKYSETVKVAALTDWAEDAGDALPLDVINVLTDPQLSTRLKLKLAVNLLEN